MSRERSTSPSGKQRVWVVERVQTGVRMEKRILKVLAVAASILTAAYHMLKYGVEYRDLGPNHFERDKQLQANRLLRRLKALGVEVIVKPAA
jgi:hypothetical protein